VNSFDEVASNPGGFILTPRTNLNPIIERSFNQKLKLGTRRSDFVVMSAWAGTKNSTRCKDLDFVLRRLRCWRPHWLCMWLHLRLRHSLCGYSLRSRKLRLRRDSR
jgi:hypothetical protein